MTTEPPGGAPSESWMPPPPPYGAVPVPPLGLPPRPPPRPTPGRTNHILHLLLTLLSFGAWGIVWLFLAINQQTANRQAQERYERAANQYEIDYYNWQLGRYHRPPGQPRP